MAAEGGCGYLLVFDGELLDGSMSGIRAQRMLTSRMSKTLPIPILDKWYEYPLTGAAALSSWHPVPTGSIGGKECL